MRVCNINVSFALRPPIFESDIYTGTSVHTVRIFLLHGLNIVHTENYNDDVRPGSMCKHGR